MTRKAPIFKPYRASDIDWDKAKFPLMAMPKIDGVRGVNFNGVLTGRTMRKFNNLFTTDRFSKPQYTGLDGEFTIGPDRSPSLCRDTSSAINSIEGEPDLVWYLFDLCALTVKDKPYIERYEMMRNHIESQHALGLLLELRVIPYEMVFNREDAMRVHAQHVEDGYEGTIYRLPTATYKHGTSTARECGYMREKDFVQEDAIVLSVIEGETNYNDAKVNSLGHTVRSTNKDNMVPNNQIGSLICRDVKTGKTIRVGAGQMSHLEREQFFIHQQLIVGKTISYKHFPYGAKTELRFPTFVSIRGDNDVLPPEM